MVLRVVVTRVLLTAGTPASRELDQRLLPLLPTADPPAPPLQEEDVRVLRHVADNIIMYNSVVGNMPSNIAKQYKLSLFLFD